MKEIRNQVTDRRRRIMNSIRNRRCDSPLKQLPQKIP